MKRCFLFGLINLFVKVFGSFDGGDEEEVGANLHHEHEAGESYNDERWAWMQTEVQRISTE